jgi:hypothetical protein
LIRWVVILCMLQAVAFWKILPRMGFPPWLAIMASIPVVNLILYFYLALTPWPVESRKPPADPGGSDAGF